MFSPFASRLSQVSQAEAWVAFPGGELEGRRPQVMCRACRDRATRTGLLCFQCYRAELNRERSLKAAGELNTASEARFQCALPFEPVNRPRLDWLRAERATARAAAQQTSTGRMVDRQRRAQIAARHALQRVAANLHAANTARRVNPVHLDMAIHAAELQLPESWLPFVSSQ